MFNIVFCVILRQKIGILLRFGGDKKVKAWRNGEVWMGMGVFKETKQWPFNKTARAEQSLV